MKNIIYFTSACVTVVIVTAILVTICIYNNKREIQIIDFELKEPIIKKSNSIMCMVDIDPGTFCKKVSKRYGFNGIDCVEFTYGGCGGNENNFYSLEQCVLLCI